MLTVCYLSQTHQCHKQSTTWQCTVWALDREDGIQFKPLGAHHKDGICTGVRVRKFLAKLCGYRGNIMSTSVCSLAEEVRLGREGEGRGGAGRGWEG